MPLYFHFHLTGLPSSTPLRKTHHLFTSPSTSSLSPTLNLSKSRRNGTDISSKNVSFAAGSLNEDDKEFFSTGSLNEDEKEFEEEEEEQFEPFDEDEEIFEQDITASSMASRRVCDWEPNKLVSMTIFLVNTILSGGVFCCEL